MKAMISDIQRFCMHDGPGVRTTVFLKGCPLNCKWCHNPETKSAKTEIMYYDTKCIECGNCVCCPNGAHTFDGGHRFDRFRCSVCGLCAENCPAKALEKVGRYADADEIIDTVCRDADFYSPEGGVTISGGEPMNQPEAVLYILKELKKKNIRTALETCGYFNWKYLDDLVKYTDIFLWDIKDTDDCRHKENTGVSNSDIIDNLLIADNLGAKTILRCILVNNINTDEKHYKGIAEIFGKLKNCIGAELIPYHTFGGSKHKALFGYDNGKKEWIPSQAVLDVAKRFLTLNGVKII